MPPKKKLTMKKKGKERRVKKSKKTKSKKPKEKIKPEKIGRILSNIHILLSFPSIEFLPSTNIFLKNNTGHYIQMIDYQGLGQIINNNPIYKKSPTIQKIFNYESYELERYEEIAFNYNNVKCDNLVIKEQKNYNVKLLFLYLLECNVNERLKDIIQLGGEGEYDIEKMIDYDVNIKKNEFDEFKKKEIEDQKEKELERIRELEREKFRERERLENEMKQLKEKEIKQKELEKQNDFEEKIKSQTQKVVLLDDDPPKDINQEINEERKLLDEIEDEKVETEENKKDEMNIEKRDIDKTIKEKEDLERKLNMEKKKMLEKAMKNRQEMEKRIDIKLKGFEEYLENKKVMNVSKNSFALYNVNWFNVCCGFEKLDDTFEEEVNKQIIDMGIVVDEKEITENLLRLFEDKRELSNFKKMIKNRLITCSEIESPSFFEKLFTDSFGSFKPCDKRTPQAILYLYDDYRTFLEKDISITKLERVLILIYCEIRQHNLSKYISLEIIRKENEKKRTKNIIKILDEIMKGDKNVIRNNDKMLKQKTKLKYEEYKRDKLEEIKEKNRIKTLINENNIIIQKKKVEDLVEDRDEKIEETRKKKKKELENKTSESIFSTLGKLFERNKDSPLFELTLTPKEREAYEKAMKRMKGGSEDDNMIHYELTDETKSNMCNKIKGEKNIYKEQLSMINHCFN
tara:strand:- start:1321 stop:3378 length:2058 start_codon:yes stop_codon:yes gene_type:complete